MKAKHPAVASRNIHPLPCPRRKSSFVTKSWCQTTKSPTTRKKGSRQDKVLLVPQMPWAHNRRLHPSVNCNRTPHSARTTQAVREEPRVVKEDHRAHHRWYNDGQDSGNVCRAVRRFPKRQGNRPLLMHFGTGPLHQRHHRRNPEYFHGEHEKEVRGAHECQLVGPLQFQHRRKTTVDLLRL